MNVVEEVFDIDFFGFFSFDDGWYVDKGFGSGGFVLGGVVKRLVVGE